MNEVYLSSEIITDSIVDGVGLRAVIWFQGCSHNCKNCHNPETHPFNIGIKYSLEELYEKIDDFINQDGVTFSGGDPMFQPESFLEVLKYTKSKGYNIWCYTGYTYEELSKMKPIYLEILKYIDVLVDGRYDESLQTLNAKYRGSSNQRVIDIKKTLESESVVTLYE
ncbi:MAG: anaerobic ribonucleoside-triphosphate reductase activating protein [bacterium]